MGAPRVLLVDDDQQLGRMLKTSLEYSGREFIVVDVPSGEEALLELGRGRIDLLVTDLRLPGINGLELVERARQVSPNTSSIIITGHPTEEDRRKAESLGVITFIQKPIGTSFFLEAVERGLEIGVQEIAGVEIDDEEIPKVADRLTGLRRELGADAVFLLDERGQIVVRAGDLTELDLDAALPSLLSAFSAGLKVSSFLGSYLPSNFQYFDGDSHDIYLTNVGAYYSLLIAFRGHQEAGQMGSVVHFGRRTAGALLEELSRMGVVEGTQGDSRTPDPEEKASERQTIEMDEGDLKKAARDTDKLSAEQYWDDATSEATASDSAGGDSLTYDQARKLGLVDEEKEGE